MENELLELKSKLKKVETVVHKPNLEKMKEIPDEKVERMRNQFFEGGVQNWYNIVEPLTFKTLFIDLSLNAAKSLIKFNKEYSKTNEMIWNNIINDDFLCSLNKRINELIEEHNWSKYFIKLSVRSPKDSPLILKKGKEEFKKVYNSNPSKYITFEDKYKLFSSCVQNNFCVTSSKEAFEYMLSSKRVIEDLDYALEKENDYDKFKIQVVLREWKEAIPISNEFRGFVWKGKLNAIGQYYHIFSFPELFGREEEIKENINKLFEEKLKQRLPKILEDCIVDFAFFDKDNIKIVELNPFDGYSIASFSGSTGLFLLDVPEDRKIIENGPLTLRILKEPIPEVKLKGRVDKLWMKELKEFI